MQFHGMLPRMTSVNPPQSKYYTRGRFGRLFPNLPPAAENNQENREKLKEIGAAGGVMDGGGQSPIHPGGVTAGFTFLGQFIDHDITFDPTSDIEAKNDPEALANFRTPALELDSVYGSGPGPTPFLYDRTTPNDAKKLLFDEDWPKDLPRNSQRRALIGDPRNDENMLVSQLHLAFLRFHNRVIDRLTQENCTHENTVLEEAQRIVRWHYQWIVLHEFLPLMVGQSLVDDILKKGRKVYHWNVEPFIPVEFSVAAYRFGHTMVQGQYECNANFKAPIFDLKASGGANDPEDLRGGVRPDAPVNFRRFVEWDRFFTFKESSIRPQVASRLDTLVPTPLFGLTGIEEGSLPARNLERGLSFCLPAGQDVARAMQEEVLDAGELSELKPYGFHRRTPLWYYILREADILGRGKTLGPVGGRIVGEVLIGLLQGDSNSFLRRQPDWMPTELDTYGRFSIVDLLNIAQAPTSFRRE